MQARKSIIMQWNYILLVMHSLLQDAANATLRSETLRRNCVRCHNRKRWCKKRLKRCKTFAMEDASNTVQILVACAMQGIRFSSINYLRWGGTKETGSQMKVCAMYNILFTRMNCLWLGSTKEMASQIKGVCDIRHAVHSDELFTLRHERRNGSNEQDVCDMRQTCL